MIDLVEVSPDNKREVVEVSPEGTHEIIEVPVGDAPEIVEVSTSRAGRAATVAIGTVTTGSPGSDANVTNSGTAGEAVLDFTIPTGDTVELRISGGYLQWKNTTAATWTNILEIADITATIDIGTVTTGDPGTDVAVTNSGVGKDAVFNFAIPRGDSVELRIDSGYLQWKGTVDEVWNNLYAISAITPTITVGTVTTGNAGTNVAVTNSGIGKDGIFNFTIPRGDDVQLRIDSGYLQWKNTTASTWTNIVQITDITATIEVGNVTTGTSSSVTNVGTMEAAVFDFVLQKGDQGDPGPKGDPGDQGDPGPKGDPGTDGITWFMGTTDPTTEGVDGDLYLNYTTWHVWEKTSGTWTDKGTIKGAEGEDGTDGNTILGGTVDPTTEGVDGDWYINRTTWHIWEKATGTWTDRGTIKGADGSGSGDVTGPSSSVDGNFAAFDGVTGKLIKDSGKAIADFAGASHTHSYLANVSEDTTPELGGALDCNNALVYWDIYSISGTAINVAKGNKQKLTLSTTNITVSLSTPSGACAFHLFIYQGATARTITWPTIKWMGGTAPNLNVSNGRFVVCLAWDGTSWFGSWGAYS